MNTRLVCSYCDNYDIKPYGFDRHKVKRRYRCTCCRKTFQNCYDFVGSKPGIEREVMKLINDGKTYINASSILGVSSKKIARAIRNHRELEKNNKS